MRDLGPSRLLRGTAAFGVAANTVRPGVQVRRTHLLVPGLWSRPDLCPVRGLLQEQCAQEPQVQDEHELRRRLLRLRRPRGLAVVAVLRNSRPLQQAGGQGGGGGAESAGPPSAGPGEPRGAGAAGGAALLPPDAHLGEVHRAAPGPGAHPSGHAGHLRHHAVQRRDAHLRTGDPDPEPGHRVLAPGSHRVRHHGGPGGTQPCAQLHLQRLPAGEAAHRAHHLPPRKPAATGAGDALVGGGAPDLPCGCWPGCRASWRSAKRSG